MEKDRSWWTLRRRARAEVDRHNQQKHHNVEIENEQNELGQNIGDDIETDSMNNDLHDVDYTVSDVESVVGLDRPTEVVNNLGILSDSDSLDFESDDNFNQEEFERDLENNIVSDDDSFDGYDDLVEDDNPVFGVEERLSRWATEFQNHVSHAALSGLLAALRPDYPNLPKDPRTLLSTDVHQDILRLAGGEYYHFGIKECVIARLSSHPCDIANLLEISLDINIDGLPIFKSSSGQLWPILGLIKNLPVKDPFVIGIYYGMSKPADITEYLSYFVEDVRSLAETGLNFSGINFPVVISAFICDAPARAFVKQIKGHSGYYACERCTQRGVYLQKVTFPSTDSPLRTDELFSEMAYENHQTGRSPLMNIPAKLVTQFPLDYMHLICLGVTRRLILLWKRGPLRCRISAQSVREISELLVSLKGFVPREFARKPRSLMDIDRWKATEFRQFLLYTGPVVLSQTLPDEMYKNFLILSVAVHILLSPHLCRPTLLNNAKILLVNFVEHFGDLYGKDQIVYNVHSLIHIHQDAVQYGPLDNVSAFPFENYLGKLKKLVRKPSQPLQQIVRRLSEKRDHGVRPKKVERLKGKHMNGPVPRELSDTICQQYQELNGPFGCIRITCHADNCVEVQGKVAVVKNIVVHDGTEYIVYVRFRTCSDFFMYPIPSQEIGISKVSDFHWQTEFAPVSEITGKVVLVPLTVAGGRRQTYVAAPFLHSQ